MKNEQLPFPGKQASRISPGMIAFIYGLIGVIWIVASDWIVNLIGGDPETITYLQIYKGWFYILVTALMLYGLIRLYGKRLMRSQMLLEQMSRRTELILESAGEGVFGLDTNGNHTFINKYAADVLGYTVDELIGKNGHTIYHHSKPDGSPYPLEECPVSASYRDGTAHIGEDMFWRKDGSRLPIDFTSRPLIDDGAITGAVVTFRDITERKQAEATRAYLSAIVESTNVAIISLTKDLDGTIQTWNKGAERVYGYSAEEIMGRHISLLVPPDLPNDLAGILERIKRGETAKGFETIRVRKDGIRIHVSLDVSPIRDHNGMIIGASTIAHDITDRKLAEEALRESESRLQGIASTALDAVVLIDNDGNVTFWNDAATRMFGYANEEIMGKYLHSYIMPERHINAFKEGFTFFRSTGKGPFVGAVYEIEARRKDGTEFPVELSLSSLQLKGMWNAVGIVRDITRRRRSEDQIRKSYTLSEAVNRINSVIFSTRNPDEIMNLVLREAVTATGADAGVIFIPEDDRWVARYQYGVSPIAGRAFSSNDIRLSVTAVKERKAVLLRDLQRDKGQFRILAADYHARSLIDAPLFLKEDILGDLALYSSKSGQVFSEMHLDFIKKVAASVSLALENAQLFEERKRMEGEMRQMAHHDSLTGLPNRRLFIDIANVEREQANRRRTKMGVLFLDLDRFKEVNDTFGHEAGDRLLKEAASRLRTAVRRSDTIARIGGDEFNAIIADIVHPEDIADIAGKIVEVFRKPFLIMDQHLHITTSIGISIYPDDSGEIDELLKYADIAMYDAKENGRNRYRFYNASINMRSLERIRMASMLQRSLEFSELVLYYQPLVDIRTRRVVSAEALVRWHHPERGLLEPKDFIPAAEETGYIAAIDEWSLKTACTQVRRWLDAGNLPVCVTVNVSARQFLDRDLVGTVSSILKETGAPPECLDLEITETTAMTDVGQSAERLKELSDMGIHISIDDFGTGYSSLNYLKRLPIERLKIDRSFISDIPASPDDKTIVEAVTAMAHNMKMKVVAEGVETEEQLEFLRQTGCDEMQGFLFSEALPLEEFEELVAGRQ